MPAWSTLTADDLNASSVAGKVALIRATATRKSLPDPVPAAIALITGELRGAIGFSGRYLLDVDTTTLPPSLLDLAVKKIVRDLSKAVSFPLTADEAADERTYESRLDKIRTGSWPIETPANPVATPAVQTSVVTPIIKPRPRQFGRDFPGAY